MQQGRSKPLETRGHKDFRYLNVFEKQRALGRSEGPIGMVSVS